MQSSKLVSHRKGEKGYSFLFANTDRASLAGAVQSLFKQEGYTLEEGTPEYGVYGIGSSVRRAIFGALAKRYRFSISVSDEAEGVRLDIEKAMSGAMGGVIGVVKIGKELDRIASKVESISP